MWRQTVPAVRIQCLARRLESASEKGQVGNFYNATVDFNSGLLVICYENYEEECPNHHDIAITIRLRQDDPMIIETYKQSGLDTNSDSENPFEIQVQQKSGASVALKFSTRNQLLKVMAILNACRWNLKLSDFQPLRTLGRGKFGKVVFAKRFTQLGGAQSYAIKQIPCKKVSARKSAWNERIVLERISLSPCSFLVQMKYAMTLGWNCYLVMDLMRGGDMYNLLCSHSLNFAAMSFYAAEILLALEHLHSLEIIYRDVKPENILLDELGHIKLGDFGLSMVLSENSKRKSVCGTAPYVAPEMFHKNGYSYSVDYWQYGCFVYEMFAGQSPFYHPKATPMELKKNILDGQYTLPNPCSKRWEDLVTNLLVAKVSARIGFREFDQRWETVKQRPFFAHLDWSQVESQQYAPPFCPVLPGETFIQNFDEEFTSEDPTFSDELIDEEEASFEEEFEGFEFCSPHKIQLDAALNHQNNTHQIANCHREQRSFSSSSLVKSRTGSCDFSVLCNRD
mmetsp:Transcript_15290/g.19587  ORF Transcript_15290/g.19587 Transcript_15290/m.19587 type:complete len:510 (-) Transcript_15290:274-1803(-)